MTTSALRKQLIEVTLAWQTNFGVAPSITSAISEFDAALLVGMSADEYSAYMADQTAVAQGSDFVWKGARFQVKANRPSGKSGSIVTLVPKAKNYDWDRLIWILYDTQYEIVEAWIWDRDAYRAAFDNVTRLSPKHYREGRRLR